MKRAKKVSQIGEFGLIEQIRRDNKTSSSIVYGIGDDTAVTKLDANTYQLLTTDMLVEGKHFTSTMSFEKVGRKALACSISDIAAMGGTPQYALVSLGVSKNCSVKLIKELYRGIRAMARQFDVDIVGGDTVESKKTVINIALIGKVAKKNLVLRSKARVGDQIFVTGSLGRSFQTEKHLDFKPRVDEAHYLVRKFNPTAMIDISDGFAQDLNHILESSDRGAVVLGYKLPKTPQANLRQALYDGEDFELIFTLSPTQAKKLLNSRKKIFTHVGEITKKSEGFVLVDEEGQRKILKPVGYEHFGHGKSI